jgi:hypothetical protein
VTRPIPLVDDLPLDAVAWIRQRTTVRASSLPVAGLAGDAQQLLGRGSHEMDVAGVVVGEESKAQLEALQKKAAEAAEVPFHADVTAALEVERVVVVEAEFLEEAGRPGRYEYRLLLRESPPLPPPAEEDPFGLGDLGLGALGLPDLGFGDLGDVLGDITDLAATAQDALDAVTGAIEALDALGSLTSIATGSPLQPLLAEAGELSALGDVAGVATTLNRLLTGEG